MPAAAPLTVMVEVPSGVAESPDAVVATVNVVVVPEAVGVTLLLENCPVAPAGSPPTLGVTGPEKPFIAVIVTV
jgi:hypothetical protein